MARPQDGGFYYRFLERGAIFLERAPWSAVNGIGQYFYRHMLMPILNFALKLKFPSAKLFLRGSWKRGSGFNLLYSDLDLGIESDGDFPELAAWYLNLKRWIPSLGELEIYTPTEHQLLQDAQGRHGTEHRFFRNIRKLGWKQRELEHAKLGYHRDKLQRSVQKCAAELALSDPGPETLRQQLDSVLKHFLAGKSYAVPVPLDAVVNQLQSYGVFCPYLGWSFGTRSDAQIPITPPVGLLLLAVTPPADRRSLEVDDLVAAIRAGNAKIAACFHDLETIERLEFQASYRGLPAEKQETWMQDYMAWLGINLATS